jgi:tetratricopeptide (TPR) repeat protein
MVSRDVELPGKSTADRCGIHCQGAHLIINRLNGLPLALTQAGSYLRQTNMAASTYVKYYDSMWRVLMKKHDRFPLQEYGDRSVLTTWKMSYEQVQSQSEEAAGLLRLWGFLDCGDLWYELVACASRLNERIKKPDWLLRLAENELEFLSSLQLLSHYSLVDAKEDAPSHSMHAVLHEWCCQLADGSERSMLSELAASIVAHMTPDESEPEYWKLRKRLLPHGSRVQRWMDERLEQPDGASGWVAQPWIYYYLGVLFAHQGKLVEAEKMYMWALQGYEKALGAKHPSTLDTVNNLGALYRNQGKLAEAEEMYMRALKGYEKTFGVEHTSTLGAVVHLGILYWHQGKQIEAEKMYMWALQGYEKALGAEHTSTLDTVNNLGILYWNQGKQIEAEKMYMWALQGYEKALGAEHTSTLNAVTNLGILYWSQGKLIEAEKMYMRALQGYEKALGAEHTSTLNIVNNLGFLYWNQGKQIEAEKTSMRALQGYEKALGAEHTSTLDTVNNLGVLYLDQGKLVEAEEMFMRALDGYENALGAENVVTYRPALNTIENLGGLYRDQAKLAEAESMFSRALIGFQAILGPSHEKCQRLSSAITSLGHFEGMGNEIITSQLDLEIRDD